MFENHIRMVRHLSYHKDSLRFIAKYYFNAKFVDKDKINFKSFTLILEEGMEDYAIIDKRVYSYIEYFKYAGKRELFTWLSCLIGGILELQKLGIFHGDLEFRNTIKLEKGYEYFTYKIIDFDNFTFKVKGNQEEKHQSLFNHTKTIIEFWLNSDE